MLNTMKMKWVGTAPLLLHNSQLANPLNAWSRALKAVSGKRKKTDEDYQEMQRIEWFGGLYLDENGRIAIPADLVLGTLISGAKKFKNGPQAKAGIFEAAPFFLLDYSGPTDPEALFARGQNIDQRSVKVQQNRIERTRPRFDEWSVETIVNFDGDVITESDVQQAAEKAGQVCGLGDYRPRYGRFDVTYF